MYAFDANVKATPKKITNMTPTLHPMLLAYGLIIAEVLFWVSVVYLFYKRKQKKKSMWHE